MACEKCWGDAYFRWRFVDSGKSQSEHYRELLEERKNSPCTPEEQAGQFEDRWARPAREDAPITDADEKLSPPD